MHPFESKITSERIESARQSIEQQTVNWFQDGMGLLSNIFGTEYIHGATLTDFVTEYPHHGSTPIHEIVSVPLTFLNQRFRLHFDVDDEYLLNTAILQIKWLDDSLGESDVSDVEFFSESKYFYKISGTPSPEELSNLQAENQTELELFIAKYVAYITLMLENSPDYGAI